MELALRYLSIQSILMGLLQDLLDVLNMFLLVPRIDDNIIQVHDVNRIN
jgi:hypothetical protein